MSSQRWRRTSLRRRPPSSGPARTVAWRADYQNVVAEQRATQKILEFALKKLDSFYNKKSLLSITIHRSQAPGEATSAKKGAATGVMEMIKMIIADAKHDEQVRKHL
mmetsp:Transcript_40552/g.91301  ORF Transcript_40552/g.91301 Transcript_40552/m.91301 type:complete len:107 (+) Transcript_40552:1549-1869(+)